MTGVGPGRPRRSRRMAALIAVLVPGTLLAACSSGPTPQDVARSYLADWAARDWSAMRGLVTTPPADFTAVNTTALTDLGATHASYRAGQMSVGGTTAHEPVTEEIQVAGVGTVHIKTTLRLSDVSAGWRVVWSPTTIAPALRHAGDHLALAVTWPQRAQILTAADFTRTAARYLIGAPLSLGLPAFAGSVPPPSDLADLAATAIGQGRVLVSPLNMAVVAAAVDTGQVRAASLVAAAAGHGALPAELPPAVVTGLHQMMAQVVASGTAANKGLPPGTFAKTGTAEYGHGNPLPTDAWLIGFNNSVVPGSEVAFAMVTVDGGEGGPTDGPVVARFLDLLHQSRE